MSHDILFDTRSGCFIDEAAWTRESKIDQCVLKHPEIVSRLLADGDEYVVALAGAGHGGPQLLGIDALFLLDKGDEPRLVVWESKLEGNVHPRRLIGQVIDYASELAAMPADVFASELSSRTTHLTWRERFKDSSGRGAGEVEARAKQAHREGRFTLVVCAPTLPDDVVRMMGWLTDKMGRADVQSVAIELGPVGADGWIRAAALLNVIRGGLDLRSLDEQFDNAVQKFRGLVSTELVAVEAQQRGNAALSLRADRPAVRRPSGSAAATSPTEWRANAEPAMRALYERLKDEFPTSIAEWKVGTRALLLNLKVGDGSIEALRLFGNRVYFVSDKDLLQLGATDDHRWWREAVSKLPVTDATAKQPVVAGEKLNVLLENKDVLMGFLHELQARASAAAKS